MQEPRFCRLIRDAAGRVNDDARFGEGRAATKGKETKMELPLLNRYELLWVLVFFDLPVVEKEERKAASDFRNFLLDHGFSMVQYSIYMKLFSGKDVCEKYYRLIKENLPCEGKVDILTITDKQYGNIISYNARKRTEKKQPEELLLF